MRGYRSVDSVFPSMAAFIDGATGYTKKAPMTVVYLVCSALTKLPVNSERCNRHIAAELPSTKDKVAEVKRLLFQILKIIMAMDHFL